MEKKIVFNSNDLKDFQTMVVKESRKFGTNCVICNSQMAKFLEENAIYAYAKPQEITNNIIGKISDISIIVDDTLKEDEKFIILKK